MEPERLQIIRLLAIQCSDCDRLVFSPHQGERATRRYFTRKGWRWDGFQQCPKCHKRKR